MELTKSKQTFFENHRKNNPELYKTTEFLNEHYENVSIVQRQWHIDNDMLSLVMCRTCGQNLAPFDKKHKLYKNCSKECHKKELGKKASISNANPLTQKKKLDTFIERYGSENPYAIIGKTMKETNLKKYGVENQVHRQEISDKTRQTKLKTFLENNLPKEYELLDKNESIIRLLHIDCGSEFEINPSTFLGRRSNDVTICTKCLPLYKSSSESDLLDYIKSIYSGDIKLNCRNLIPNMELDIYIPELNLAFEFNGLYWHSEIFKDKNYHQNKWQACKDKNIKLITIWEDSWREKKSIIKSIINTNFDFGQTTIYARKCKLLEIKGNEEKSFLDTNHNQGYISSSICYGLYFDNELVQMLSFRKIKDKTYEIARICSKQNHQIIGGISKLFKYFQTNNSFDKVVSYCDLSLFDGKVYSRLGMQYVYTTVPSYFYFNEKSPRTAIRLHRVNFQKWKLLKKYKQFNESMTEKDMMNSLGFQRLYGLGNSYYELII